MASNVITIGCYKKADSSNKIVFLGFRVLKRLNKYCTTNSVTTATIQSSITGSLAKTNNVYEVSIQASSGRVTVSSVTDLKRPPKNKAVSLGSTDIKDLNALLRGWENDDRNALESEYMTIVIPPIGEGDFGAEVEIKCSDFIINVEDFVDANLEGLQATYPDYNREQLIEMYKGILLQP